MSITYQDLEKLVFDIACLWNSMTGSRAIPSKEYITALFSYFDVDRDGDISFDDYFRVYQCRSEEILGFYEFLNYESINI